MKMQKTLLKRLMKPITRKDKLPLIKSQMKRSESTVERGNGEKKRRIESASGF